MENVLDFIKTRRSVRRYKKDPVPEELINQVIEAGLYAATGHNRQTPIIVAVTNPDVHARLAKVNAKYLGKEGIDPFYGAPVILIVLNKTEMNNCREDGSLVLGNMMLMAHGLGLGSCWINRAKETFAEPEWQQFLRENGIPDGYEGIGHLILGYPDGPESGLLPRKPGRVYGVR